MEHLDPNSDDLPPGVTPLHDESADDAELLPFDVSGVPPKQAPPPTGQESD